jgi:hypothetical protein
VRDTIDSNGGPNVAHGHVNIVEDMVIGLEAQRSVTEQADVRRNEPERTTATAASGTKPPCNLEGQGRSSHRRAKGDRYRLTKRINALRYLIGLICHNERDNRVRVQPTAPLTEMDVTVIGQSRVCLMRGAADLRDGPEIVKYCGDVACPQERHRRAELELRRLARSTS